MKYSKRFRNLFKRYWPVFKQYWPAIGGMFIAIAVIIQLIQIVLIGWVALAPGTAAVGLAAVLAGVAFALRRRWHQKRLRGGGRNG